MIHHFHAKNDTPLDLPGYLGHLDRRTCCHRLNMKSVIITGASDGIGRGMALAFAKRGYKLGLIARRESRLKEVAELCLKAGAPQAEYSAVDITQSDPFRAALEALDKRLSGTDIFIANAGFGDSAAPSEDGGPLARRMVDLNVAAAFDGIEWMKAKMVTQKHGQIVGISSVAGIRGLPGSAIYSATKAALRIYLEALRIETASSGLLITTIEPGFIATAANLKSGQTMPFLMSVDRASEIFVRGILASKRRIIAPWPYKGVVWLLSYLPSRVYALARFFI
ncbi:SDR family NAD(P)-dependent oxidoreductase [Bdellovibrionota bacterium FG-1]